MLSVQRLTEKFKAALNEQEENDSPEAARDRIAAALAQAVIEEIMQLKIVYSAGLTAPNGPVTGTFNHTVQ